MLAQEKFIWRKSILRQAPAVFAILFVLSVYQSGCFYVRAIKPDDVFQSEASSSNFHITIIQPKISEDHTRIAIGYTTDTKLERDGLIKLAKRLRKQFVADSKVRVIFFSNKEDAILYGKKLIDYPTKENLRVIYARDKSKNEEYIEYVPNTANATKKMIKLKLKG